MTSRHPWLPDLDTSLPGGEDAEDDVLQLQEVCVPRSYPRHYQVSQDKYKEDDLDLQRLAGPGVPALRGASLPPVGGGGGHGAEGECYGGRGQE